ncbi:MAG: sulfate permease [Chloroflexota bacterium]
MQATLGANVIWETTLKPAVHYLRQPIRFVRGYERENLLPDFIAGLTLTVLLLPQAIAYALIAELPPVMGLYTAMLRGFIGAFWGSSNHLNNGPTNTASLLILSSLLSLFEPGTSEFIVAAGLIAVLAGLIQFIMGLARLGVLVNFVSHSVIVGFASGAGILIALKQIRPLLGLSFSGRSVVATIQGIATNLVNTHWATAVLGFATIIFLIVIRRISSKLPRALLAMILSSAAIFIFGLDDAGVDVIGELPASLPPFANLPLFDFELIGKLMTGALALAAIGLVESIAIARTIAAQTGQRLDSNQEFVGQGLANIASGLFTGFAGSGSFTRSAVNYNAGGKTPMSAIFSSILLFIAVFAVAPLAAYLPRTALAGVLIVTAYGMIDQEEISRIWYGARGDAVIMVMTLLGTLFLELEFAVLVGIIVSLIRYILRTSTPRVQYVLPDHNYKHFTYQPDKEPCPQLGIIDILGDMYFGAVNHIEEFILKHAEEFPEQRFLLVRMHSVNNCDFSGVHMLESVVRAFRERGGDVFLVRVNPRVQRILESTEFIEYLGKDHVMADDLVISDLFHHVLDPAVCIYECPTRAFKECLNLPKQIALNDISVTPDFTGQKVDTTTPKELWDQLHTHSNGSLPLVIDVREPREYRRGHIAEATSIPLSSLFDDGVDFPHERALVFVCRSGRRSRRAASLLQQKGHPNVSIVKGGMLAWEAAELLEAID